MYMDMDMDMDMDMHMSMSMYMLCMYVHVTLWQSACLPSDDRVRPTDMRSKYSLRHTGSPVHRTATLK